MATVDGHEVIYEQAGDGGWNVRAAHLAVYSCGATRDDAAAGIREALALHLAVLAERERS